MSACCHVFGSDIEIGSAPNGFDIFASAPSMFDKCRDLPLTGAKPCGRSGGDVTRKRWALSRVCGPIDPFRSNVYLHSDFAKNVPLGSDSVLASVVPRYTADKRVKARERDGEVMVAGPGQRPTIGEAQKLHDFKRAQRPRLTNPKRGARECSRCVGKYWWHERKYIGGPPAPHLGPRQTCSSHRNSQTCLLLLPISTDGSPTTLLPPMAT